VLFEFLTKPDTGSIHATARSAGYAAVLFVLLSLVFMPGVFAGYVADARIPREEFFRACGKDLWRFLRLGFFPLPIAIPISMILGAIKNALVKAADNTSNERLPFFVSLGSSCLTFIVLLAIRAWFDLAQADVVVRNEGRVRKSLASGFRTSRRYLGRLV